MAIYKSPNPVETEEIVCPNCRGKGVFIIRDDQGRMEDYKTCTRCHGTGTIIVIVKKEYPRESL